MRKKKNNAAKLAIETCQKITYDQTEKAIKIIENQAFSYDEKSMILFQYLTFACGLVTPEEVLSNECIPEVEFVQEMRKDGTYKKMIIKYLISRYKDANEFLKSNDNVSDNPDIAELSINLAKKYPYPELYYHEEDSTLEVVLPIGFVKDGMN